MPVDLRVAASGSGLDRDLIVHWLQVARTANHQSELQSIKNFLKKSCKKKGGSRPCLAWIGPGLIQELSAEAPGDWANKNGFSLGQRTEERKSGHGFDPCANFQTVLVNDVADVEVGVGDVADDPEHPLVSSRTEAAGGGSDGLQLPSWYCGNWTSPKRNMSNDTWLTHGSRNKLARIRLSWLET